MASPNDPVYEQPPLAVEGEVEDDEAAVDAAAAVDATSAVDDAT